MRHSLLMFALAVSASGQQKAPIITTESLGLKKTVYRCDSGWKVQTWGRWLQTPNGPVWHGDQYFDEPDGFAEVLFQDDPPDLHPPRCVKDESGQQEKPHYRKCEGGWHSPQCVDLPDGSYEPVTVGERIEAPTPKTHRKHPKPTNQSVWLIDGRRAYLSCPDDKRQDCTLSVSRHAVYPSSDGEGIWWAPGGEDPRDPPEQNNEGWSVSKLHERPIKRRAKPKPSGHAVSTHTKAGK